MALAEFEREQTSERVKEATYARAKRGLWNGGQIMGYDLDPKKKGHLIPNDREKALVNFVFDTYLKNGSYLTTANILNKHGYRTKEYSTRSGKLRAAKEFCYSSIQQMLTNYAYIGKKEINKRGKRREQSKLPENEQYQIVDALWEPVVGEEKFWAVQELIKKNCRTRHNSTARIRHNYVLNGGLLWCAVCGNEMEGRSGTGQKRIRYYYYVCKDKACGFKVSASEIEDVVIDRIKAMSKQEDMLRAIVAGTNRRLQKELPQLRQQRQLLHKELEDVKALADGIMGKWVDLASEESSVFLRDKLDELGRRRKDIDDGVKSLELMIEEIEGESVNEELVVLALSRFGDVFDHIQPYKQKDLIGAVLHRAVIDQDRIQIAMYGKPTQIEQFASPSTYPHFQTTARGTTSSSVARVSPPVEGNGLEAHDADPNTRTSCSSARPRQPQTSLLTHHHYLSCDHAYRRKNHDWVCGGALIPDKAKTLEGSNTYHLIIREQ